jgi:hypothetical protein
MLFLCLGGLHRLARLWNGLDGLEYDNPPDAPLGGEAEGRELVQGGVLEGP